MDPIEDPWPDVGPAVWPLEDRAGSLLRSCEVCMVRAEFVVCGVPAFALPRRDRENFTAQLIFLVLELSELPLMSIMSEPRWLLRRKTLLILGIVP